MNLFLLSLSILDHATISHCLAQNYAGNEQWQERQKTKAPLVDSTLLRFLSSQKKSDASALLKDGRGAAAGSAISVDAPIGASRGVEVDLPTFAAEYLDDVEAPLSCQPG